MLIWIARCATRADHDRLCEQVLAQPPAAKIDAAAAGPAGCSSGSHSPPLPERAVR